VELLVVISIIGALAALTVGLAGVAGRKSKESRVRAQLNQLITAIDGYHDAIGSYPPDNLTSSAARGQFGVPFPNQLFYELSGTAFAGNEFTPAGRQQIAGSGVTANTVQTVFHTDGIANAARDAKELKFTHSFKAADVKRAVGPPAIEVLAVPVKGPAWPAAWAPWLRGTDGLPINPWLYVSTSPTNNADKYDLWADVVIGSKIIRFSNWDKEPVVVGP